MVNGTKAFLPYLKAAGQGHVINVSSVFGLFSQPGMSAYNASKFAVCGFTESLRQELDMAACGVSASCVHPGGIKTNIAKTARMNDSLAKVTGQEAGQEAEQARQQFNDQLLRTTPEQAARVIVGGVLANQRRRRRPCPGLDATQHAGALSAPGHPVDAPGGTLRAQASGGGRGARDLVGCAVRTDVCYPSGAHGAAAASKSQLQDCRMKVRLSANIRFADIWAMVLEPTRHSSPAAPTPAPAGTLGQASTPEARLAMRRSP